MSADSYQPFAIATPSAPPPAAQMSPAVTNCRRAVPALSPPENGFKDWGKGADFREFRRLRRQSVTIVTAFLEGLPWTEGLKRLFSLPRPPYLDGERWDEIAFDCARICRDWGHDAARFGWSDLELFGCNPQPRAGRLDNNGLAITLRGRRLLVLNQQAATIAANQRDIHTFRRGFPLTTSVPLWIAFAPTGGP